jgi:2-polyprenyl-3-methyl-5-hydroxy-6-metoxy-1,4-benzoquinol methylase
MFRHQYMSDMDVVERNTEINPSYAGDRPDLRVHVPLSVTSVLDVGCSIGTVGAMIKKTRSCTVVGIEIDPVAAETARIALDQVIVGDLDIRETWDNLNGHTFDCVLLGDVLEHCRDPWEVMRRTASVLRDECTVVISLPNVGHYSTFVALLQRRWPSKSRGIHDATHLRWFAEKNIPDITDEAGITVRRVLRKYRIVEAPHSLNRWSKYMALPGLRSLLTHQFIVVAERRKAATR